MLFLRHFFSSPPVYRGIGNVRYICSFFADYKRFWQFAHIFGNIDYNPFFLTKIKILRSRSADGAFFYIENAYYIIGIYCRISSEIDKFFHRNLSK